MEPMTRYNELVRSQQVPARPYLTSLTADARVELSVTSFRNGADKVANALLSEFGCDAGDRIAIHLPWHWQRSVWAAGSWLVGMTVVPFGDPFSSDLTVASPQISRELLDTGAHNIATITLHPLGLAAPDEVPPGAADATALARVQPDTFLGDPQSPDAVLVDEGQHLWSVAATTSLVDQYPPGQRVAIAPGEDPAHWLIPVWYPVLSGGSVVMFEPGVNLLAEKVDVEIN
jgi:uncharacterized protein (TIGR03089 family)